MGKPRQGIRCSDALQRVGTRLLQRVTGPCPDLPSQGCEFGPAQCKGGEGRRRRWQREKTRPTVSKRLLDACDVMGAQVVHHHHIARRQRGAEPLLHKGPKDLTIGGPVERPQGFEPGGAQSPPARHMDAIIARHAAPGSLSRGRPAIAACQGEIDACCIDTLQPPQVTGGQLLPRRQACPRDARRVPFRRVARLFFAASLGAGGADTGWAH